MTLDCPLLVECEALLPRAQALAQALGQPCRLGDPAELGAPALVLYLSAQGLQLRHTGRRAPGPVWVDFTAGKAAHRRAFGGGRGQMVAKAVGLKPGVCPLVLDATAGLGGDAFVLASLGAGLLLQERNPVVHALLADGLARARAFAAEQGDGELAEVMARLRLLRADSTQAMPAADVIYLDPMFPSRDKSAAVNKEMTAFHALVGGDADADQLLDLALAAARYRVVVKRPRKAPQLQGRAPSLTLEGKSSRFDIYALHRLPDRLAPDFPSD